MGVRFPIMKCQPRLARILGGESKGVNDISSDPAGKENGVLHKKIGRRLGSSQRRPKIIYRKRSSREALGLLFSPPGD